MDWRSRWGSGCGASRGGLAGEVGQASAPAAGGREGRRAGRAVNRTHVASGSRGEEHGLAVSSASAETRATGGSWKESVWAKFSWFLKSSI